MAQLLPERLSSATLVLEGFLEIIWSNPEEQIERFCNLPWVIDSVNNKMRPLTQIFWLKSNNCFLQTQVVTANTLNLVWIQTRRQYGQCREETQGETSRLFSLCGNLSLSRLRNVLILAGLCSPSGTFTMTAVVLSLKGLRAMSLLVFRHRWAYEYWLHNPMGFDFRLSSQSVFTSAD